MQQSAKHAHQKPARRTQKKVNRSHDNEQSLQFGTLFKGTAITLGIGMALTVITSLIAYFSADPNLLIRPLGLTAAAMTALIGGFVTIRLHGHSALLCGLFNGGMLTCAMILASLFLKAYASGYSTLVSTLLHTALILFSVAGAFLGMSRPKKHTHRRR